MRSRCRKAVSLVSQLSTDDSPAFVNGVLGTVVETKAGQPKAGQTRSVQTKAAPAEAETA